MYKDFVVLDTVANLNPLHDGRHHLLQRKPRQPHWIQNSLLTTTVKNYR